MIYRLYKKECQTHSAVTAIEVKNYCPSPFKGLFLPGERFRLKTALARTYFWFITGGKAEIFYILSENIKILHTSYVLPKCYKFCFMEKNDYEIGPCNTMKNAQRKGLYYTTLNYIVNNHYGKNTCFWILVNESNEPSIRGIEKAGFLFDGYVRKTSFTKRYYRIGEN